MFRWLEYVDWSRLLAAIEDLFEEFEIDYIAPTHGTPIVEEDIERYRNRLEKSLEEVTEAHSESDSVTAIDGIGPTYAGDLAEVGVETVSDLLAANAVRVATGSSIPESRVRTWKTRAARFEQRW
jgi:predicted RecB family nuclease